ncbi:MAG: hypothetical protein FJ077_12845 [Cyanobacteria bacterium K_DeepCast_35m_m2_023]|nr:hypothetical protein [Cyanobacteria bacterium K_DeepCast_35m_m2_023]
MSTLKTSNLQHASAASANITLASDGTIGGTCLTQTCRAWVNFNGTGAVAIRASYNVSSITDNGTGDYTVNFTTALADANYGFIGTGRGNSAVSLVMGNHDNVTQTSSALRIYNLNASFAPADPTVTNVAIFR